MRGIRKFCWVPGSIRNCVSPTRLENTNPADPFWLPNTASHGRHTRCIRHGGTDGLGAGAAAVCDEILDLRDALDPNGGLELDDLPRLGVGEPKDDDSDNTNERTNAYYVTRSGWLISIKDSTPPVLIHT